MAVSDGRHSSGRGARSQFRSRTGVGSRPVSRRLSLPERHSCGTCGGSPELLDLLEPICDLVPTRNAWRRHTDWKISPENSPDSVPRPCSSHCFGDPVGVIVTRPSSSCRRTVRASMAGALGLAVRSSARRASQRLQRRLSLPQGAHQRIHRGP